MHRHQEACHCNVFGGAYSCAARPSLSARAACELAGTTSCTPVARFVEREIRAYLDCGILARGFLRLHCDACGRDRLLAFSCKGRALCPSCGGRRMADTAAYLVDCVLPEVPVRQWVLTLPYPLRYREPAKLACDSEPPVRRAAPGMPSSRVRYCAPSCVRFSPTSGAAPAYITAYYRPSVDR